MEKIRIVYVIPSLIKGGAERLTYNTAQAIAQSGEAEVMLIQLRPGNDYGFLPHDFSIEVIPSRVVPSVKGRWIRETNELNAVIRTFRPHIIHSHLFEAEIVTRDTLFPGVVYFTHLHDNMPQFERFRSGKLLNKLALTNWYEKRWMIRQYRKCRNEFIAISRDTEQYFKQILPSDLQRIHLLNNAIDYARFHRKEPTPLEPGILRMVTTGSLVDKKNQIFLVEVIREINRRGKRADLVMLGEGPNRGRIEQAIREAGLEDQIRLLGNVDLVEVYLHQAHFYVHPATYEPFGLVILEAMAACLACVSLDGKGNRDIHVEGKNGFLIEQPDAVAFADALLRMHADPKLYESICRFSAEFASHYNITRYAERLMDIYRSALSDINNQFGLDSYTPSGRT